MNECGVAIGNEAVFTKEELPTEGLLGMDLVRLGLERGRTARQALDVITALMKEFGQGGSGEANVNMSYNNSFIIADSSEAFILETSDRRYAWKQVTDVGCISNHVSIGEDWDALSDDAVDFAVANGWWESGKEHRFDFAAAYRSTEYVPPHISEDRYGQLQLLLDEYRGKVSPQTMMRSLRDHYDSGTVFTPDRDLSDGKFFSICMHAEPVGTTAASMVAHLRGNAGPKVYWASFGTPCCGVFMPLYIEGEIPEALTRAGAEFSEDSVWWRFKKLGECVAEDYANRTPRVQKIWFTLERDFFAKAAAVESEVKDLQDNGDAEASARLTGFMQDNLDVVLSSLRELTAEFA
jgi:dipeptidase